MSHRQDEYLGNLKELGRAYKEIIGRHYPAMALVQVVALVEDARQGGNRGNRRDPGLTGLIRAGGDAR